jgi:hypothetical protein
MKKENNINYIVNNLTVTCVITDCGNTAIDRIKKYTAISNEKSYLINNTYVGIATCHENDNFDIEIGKKIALNRAKRNRAIDINNTIKKFVEDKNRELKNLTNYGIHDVPEYNI